MPEVTYLPLVEPREFGERMVYGSYRVVFDDGFTYLTAHTARPGTVSVEPVDLDLNPEFREALIARATEQHGLLRKDRTMPETFEKTAAAAIRALGQAEDRIGELENVVRLLAGGWYLDAADDPEYADLFECGWLSKNSDEPGDYSLTLDGQVVIDDALKQIAQKGQQHD